MEEQLTFGSHQSLLMTVIKSQAGTLAKALLEAIMNSVDAGAESIKLTLDENSFSVADDGHGIQDRAELERVFATFGTPHEEGDAVFGRFRVGRGQMFAFARTTWRTGSFAMHVDLEATGLDFKLESGLRSVKGCTIQGKLYQPLDPSTLSSTQSELLEMIRFLAIPVTLNGKRLSRNLKRIRWTAETEDAYILLTSEPELRVYNQGVLVRAYPASMYGSGGVVVSTAALQVNMARNDILAHSCPIWTRVQSVIRGYSFKALQSKRSLNDSERKFAAQLLGSLREVPQWLDAESLKLLEDVSGRYVSITELNRYDRVSFVPDSDRDEAKVAQRKSGALILCQSSLYAFGVYDVPELLAKLNLVSRTPIKPRAIDYKAVQSHIQHVAKTVADDKLPQSELMALNALRSAHPGLMACLESQGWPVQRRILEAGISDIYDGWTDGSRYIAINRPLLAACATQGAEGFMKLMMLLCHEYCHDSADAETHDHDRVFYMKLDDLTYARSGELLRIALRANAAFEELQEAAQKEKSDRRQAEFDRSQLDLFLTRAAA